MDSATIAKSVASGTVASSSMTMLREELTGEVRKRHGNILSNKPYDLSLSPVMRTVTQTRM